VAEGFLHDFEGWIIFVLALALMLALIWVVSWLVYRRTRFLDNFQFDDIEPEPSVRSRLQGGPRVYLLLAGLLTGGIVSHALAVNTDPVIPERESFATFPMTVGGRELYPDTLSEPVLQVLQLDDYFIGDYLSDELQPINLYMAYYAEQTEGSVIHSPKDCLPGGGWEIVSLSVVGLEGVGLPGKANRAVIRKGEDALLVYFWVNQQGKNFASELTARASLLLRSMTQNRTDGTLLRVISPLGEQSEERAEEEIRNFIHDISSDLNRFLPR
jgi:EpsI family protein